MVGAAGRWYGSFMIEIDPRYDYFEAYQVDMNKRGLRLDNWLLHRYQTGRFLRWLWDKKMDLPDVTSEVVSDYLRHRKALGNRHTTLIQVLNVLRDFFDFAVRDQLIDQNPANDVSCRWLDTPGGFAGYQGPLKRFLKDPHVIWKFRLPLFAPHWERYIGHLLDQSYAKRSLFHVLERNFYFHQYLVRKKIASFSRITPRWLNAYLRYKQRLFRRRRGQAISRRYLLLIRSTLIHFLSYAFGQEGRPFIRPRTKADNIVISNAVLQRYGAFCQIHQGLCVSTRIGYQKYLEELRSFLAKRGLRNLNEIALPHLDAFLMKQAGHLGTKSLQSVVSAFRSFFRYLHLQGDIESDLAQGLISPSRFRADRRPKYLPWKKIQDFLASIERQTQVGKRDYAILMLMACHGLRAREVARLHIADIDWDNHSLFLRLRKSGNETHMPISSETEQALRDYLAVRSPCSAPEIFLTEQAPMKPFGPSVNGVAQRHLAKFFGKLPFPGGSHLLRHSFAKALLDQGAKLHEVGSMLGHRSLRSTLIYVRINTEELREVADNYANLL